MSNWDRRFLALASHVSSWSKDPSTQVGSVIVDAHHRVIGLGYNGFPRYVADSPDRYDEKSVKYRMIVHAEANAILNAIVRPANCSLYATMFPCSDCAKLIIQSGITLICSPPPRTEGVWAEDSHFSRTMLREAHVEMVEMSL